MNRKNTEACARYVARLRAVLEELGCKRTTMGFYQYTLETRAGTLHVSVHPNGAQAGAWVATLFEEPHRTTGLLGRDSVGDPNPKWNHHFFDDAYTTDESIAEAEAELRREFARVLERPRTVPESRWLLTVDRQPTPSGRRECQRCLGTGFGTLIWPCSACDGLGHTR